MLTENIAENIVKNIKYDVIGNLISIKVDCVTRLNRSILGVNVQYIKDANYTSRP